MRRAHHVSIPNPLIVLNALAVVGIAGAVFFFLSHHDCLALKTAIFTALPLEGYVALLSRYL